MVISYVNSYYSTISTIESAEFILKSWKLMQIMQMHDYPEPSNAQVLIRTYARSSSGNAHGLFVDKCLAEL